MTSRSRVSKRSVGRAPRKSAGTASSAGGHLSGASARKGGVKTAKAKVEGDAGVRLPRTRRSAPEARQRILEAAQRELLRVGPEALRLTDLARELQVSHPAILHHFGSREGLVAAVVRHTMQGLTEQLMAALSKAAVTRSDRLDMVEMVADVCRDGGLARLLAFLLLTERHGHGRERASATLPLKRLADAAHDLRQRFGHPATYEDTLFEVQLLATVLLGDAIFGDIVRQASGVADVEAAMRDFRRRLTELLPR